MRIKKKARNEYIQAENIWIRNFTKKNVTPQSINNLIDKDQTLLIENELKNRTLNLSKISEESIGSTDILIVSDGFDFDKRHRFLSKLHERVTIIAVNGALKKWKIYNKDLETKDLRSINTYVLNNPYPEAMSYMPSKNGYFPTCIASSRSNHEFVTKYYGNKYLYEATPELGYGFKKAEKYLIDDYRNPICAAIGLAYNFGVLKLMLLCCDDSFKDERDSAVKLENGLWTYPHHLTNQKIIDANFHWLKSQEDRDVRIADYSSGINYNNAEYINCDEDAISFFNEHKEV